jgi:hypothetical protein
MFHIINTNSPNNYNSIVDLANAGTGSYVCNNNIPAGLSPTRWCKKVQAFASGGGLAWPSGADMAAQAIVPALQNGEAQFVMIDELDVGSRGDARYLISNCCDYMRLYYPQYAGRWGCFLSMADYTTLNGPSPQNAIDWLLTYNSIIACEMYVTQWAYHYASGGSSNPTTPAPNYPAGDTWLGNYFTGGGANPNRFQWLVQRRSQLGSVSRLTVVFSVYDQDLNRTQKQNAFMNHLFWVWRHKTAYPSTINATNGGVGSYKWESIGDTGRDAVFQSAWNYYCRDFNPGTGAAGPYT